MSLDISSPDQEHIVLAHGGGGELTARLIAEHFLPRLRNQWLEPLGDSAVLPWSGGPLAFTTDSHVVQPLEFPGGDIGRLAVCGTVNDLAVVGAVPLALSLAVIMEEGLPLKVLDRIIDSIAAAAAEANVSIATGDTKVVERGRGDGLIINTAGVGRLRESSAFDKRRIVPGDAVVLTGLIAEHGLAVMSAREGLSFETTLSSDVAPLNGLIGQMIASGADIKFMRDPTRGGLAGLLADLCDDIRMSIEIEETAIPISRTARHTAELLGLDPITVANEGKCVAVVAAPDAKKLLEVCRAHPLGGHAAIIGRIMDAAPPIVEMVTAAGGRRVVQRPYGEELPRIC